MKDILLESGGNRRWYLESVHAELGDECHVVLSGRVAIVDVVEVRPVCQQAFPAKVITVVILIDRVNLNRHQIAAQLSIA